METPRQDLAEARCYKRPCPNPVAWKGVLVYPKVAPDEGRGWIEEKVFSCDDHEEGLHFYGRKRVRCELCDTPLKGRKVRWCSKICWALGNGKVGWLWRLLHDRQAGLCGICVLPLNVPARWMYEPDAAGLVYSSPFDPSNLHKKLVEVDHVEPVAHGGRHRLSNLRATHGACNQAKKAKELAFYRWQIGALEEVVDERLQGVAEDVYSLLVEPRVMEGDYQAGGPGVIDGQGALL